MDDNKTEQLFKHYEAIRMSGTFNMLMDADKVMLAMKLNPRHKLDRDMYFSLIENYDKYAEKWL